MNSKDIHTKALSVIKEKANNLELGGTLYFDTADFFTIRDIFADDDCFIIKYGGTLKKIKPCNLGLFSSPDYITWYDPESERYKDTENYIKKELTIGSSFCCYFGELDITNHVLNQVGRIGIVFENCTMNNRPAVNIRIKSLLIHKIEKAASEGSFNITWVTKFDPNWKKYLDDGFQITKLDNTLVRIRW